MTREERQKAVKDAIKAELKKDLKGTGETVIVDGMGWYHDGMYCTGCNGACPYWVTDVEGVRSCYLDTYEQCQYK